MNSLKCRGFFVAALAVAAALPAASASAASVAALVDGKSLAIIDAATRKVSKTVNITGASGLVGIDVRPADGMLYGLTTDGTVVTIDTATGRATEKSKLKTMVERGAMVTVDFNPVADRLRVMGSNGQNLRANVDDGAVTTDGALKYADADMSKGLAALVIAGAYTNSYKGTKETTLYDIDGNLRTLLRQAPPNDGVLGSIGKLGIEITGPIAFDIESDGASGNKGWLVANGTIYSVDLATGKATSAGKVDVKGMVTDIAVLPAM